MGNKNSSDKFRYEVSVETGDRLFGGTDNQISIILHGDKGKTPEVPLNNVMRNDFERGTTDSFKIKAPELGELWMVEVFRKHKLNQSVDAWYLDKVVVKHIKKGTSWVFPCYKFTDELEQLRQGNSTLPQKEKTDARKQQRLQYLKAAQELYPWGAIDGLPGYYGEKLADVPKADKWALERVISIGKEQAEIEISLGIGKLLTGETWKSFDDFRHLFNLTMTAPRLHSDWTTDVRFGLERIQGAYVTAIERVTSWPIPNFPVTSDMISKFLRADMSIESEVVQNRVYLVDHSKFYEDIPPECVHTGRGVCNPKCLLYRNAENQLVPIAIQLTTNPDLEMNPIFTPDCPHADWLYAKMLFSCMDLWEHQIKWHLLGTHLVTEPMSLAVKRQLCSSHPVYKLLYPHAKAHMVINAMAREKLVSPIGQVPKIAPLNYEGCVTVLKRGYEIVNFQASALPNMLKSRNITSNPEDLPGYFYRDDGLLLWNAIRTFVHDVLTIFYKTEQDIQQDTELQNWARDIFENGFHGDEKKGFPSKISSVDELVELLTIYIFTVSAQHAALNFSQFESFGWIPLTPCHLKLLAPGANGEKWEMGKITTDDLVHALPDKESCINQVSLCAILSTYTKDDYYLGEYPETLFTESEVFDVIKKYQQQLQEAGAIIEKRSGQWQFLHPKKVPNSVGI